MLKQKIHIFNPSRSTGGTNNLLYNLALILAKTPKLQIFYVDYFDSPFVNFIKSSKLEIDIIFINKNKIYVDDSIIISILLKFKILHNYFGYTNKTKAIFWSTHPYDGMKLLSSFNLWYLSKPVLAKFIANILHFRRKKELKSIIDKGQSVGGVVWMDLVNFKKNSFFYNLKNQPSIWPIVTKSTNLEIKQKPIIKKINIVILGRLVNYKVNPLFGLFEQIAHYSFTNDIVINIDFIGDGPYKNLVINWLKIHKISNFNFIGNVNLNDLDSYLIKYDLLIGMATSVLEGAKLKIPSAIMSFSYKKLGANQLNLKWLYESKPFDVGDEYRFDPKSPKKEFSNLIKDLRNKQNPIGYKCYLHWLKYHSPFSLEEKVLKTISQNDFYLIDNKTMILKNDFLGVFIDKLKRIVVNG